MSGWIKIHRSITDHWLYNEFRVYSKLEAWYDLLLNVNYVDAKIMIKGRLYEVKRGQSIMSLDSWAKRWNWDKSKVRRFLNLLQKESMIDLISDNITTRITICKYDSYQSEGNADETQTKRKRNSNDIQTTPIKEGEEIKKDNLIDYPLLLNHINNTLGRQFKVINEKVKGSFKARFKEGYSQEDILKAITNCKASTFHKENNYEYCTPEYFSRSATLDKYSNRTIVTESDAIVAHLRAYANASKTR